MQGPAPLVLSMTTGLTSPQFRVKFDPTFQTLRKTKELWRTMASIRMASQVRIHPREEEAEGTSDPF
jgi:hypothetical protein